MLADISYSYIYEKFRSKIIKILLTKLSIFDKYIFKMFLKYGIQVMKISTPEVKNSSNLAYIQWRPVSYLSTHREVTDSTEIYSYKLAQASNKTRKFTDSFLHIYYGDKMLTNLVQKMNISLGDEGDGFYKSTRYSTW